ncbi:MAG TPA: hypothetical protein VNT26_07345 [Candidatus Sulfotelmatobacter sp.]|nr:hypothetical protein [Candidatus Sulfotelmatobacter sp.]
MDWSNIGKAVAGIAPTIGAALAPATGGVSLVASAAVTALAQAFGVEGEPTPQVLEQAIRNATPDQLIEVQKADQAFQIRMKELGVDLARLGVEDRKDARAMQVQVRSAVPGWLAFLTTFGFFGILIMLCFVGVPEANKALVYSMVGSLGTVWIMAMTFYFGTTHGSTVKNELLANSQPVVPMEAK